MAQSTQPTILYTRLLPAAKRPRKWLCFPLDFWVMPIVNEMLPKPLICCHCHMHCHPRRTLELVEAHNVHSTELSSCCNSKESPRIMWWKIVLINKWKAFELGIDFFSPFLTTAKHFKQAVHFAGRLASAFEDALFLDTTLRGTRTEAGSATCHDSE